VCLTTSLLVFTLGASHALGQSQDPKQRFGDALGSVTAALEGRFPDDGTRVAAGVAALEKALTEWDETIARDQKSMALELVKSSGKAGARLHVAMAITLAERGRVDDALKEIDAAIAVSPRDVDAHTVLGLIHSQLTSNALAATSAFRTALAADPTAPLQRYMLVKQLADQGALEEAAALGQPLRADTRSADAPDRSPFLRIQLIPEVTGVEPYFPA
jgi:tetratricopeptide (TPR) repeat protein